jgi:predicted ATPase
VCKRVKYKNIEYLDVQIALSLRNFGPVVSADILVKPLTIFIGPNASGKSYTAMALYAFVSGLVKAGIWPGIICALYVTSRRKWDTWVEERKNLASQVLKNEFARVFGMELRELTTRGAPSTEISLKLRKGKETYRYIYKWPPANLQIEIPKCSKSPDSLRKSLINWLLAIEFLQPIVYLPSSRSGLVQTYSFYVDLVLRMAEEIPIRGAHFQGLPGVVGDFLRLLIKPYRSESQLYALFRDRVGIDVERRERSIVVRDARYESDVRSAPSGYAELAPLGLLLRYGVLKRGVLAVVEEPEAHVHPDMQVKVADLLADLAAEGIYFIITTHSDYILNRIGNIIRRADSRLKQNKVSVYVFKKVDGGFAAQRLKIGPEGIPDDEFAKVYEELYREHIDLLYAYSEGRKLQS